MRAFRLFASLVGVVVLPVTACREATQIEVVVTTDVPCSHVTETSIAVGTLADVEKKPTTTLSNACDASGKLGTLVVVPSGDASAEVAVRIVLGLNGQRADACVQSNYKGGCIVARRAVHYLPHASLRVPVALQGACRDVACTPDTTCVGGQCIPAATACNGSDCPLTADAGAEPLPTRWRPMATAPDCGKAFGDVPAAVWSGTELIVWGGYTGRGAAYRPATDSWRCIPESLLDTRRNVAMVWIPTVGKAMVWAGEGGGFIETSGALYDPAGSWSDVAPAPPEYTGRASVAAVWSSATREVIFWGGADANGAEVDRGAAYNPATNTWRVLPQGTGFLARQDASLVSAGARIVLFGGYTGGSVENARYAVYDPNVDQWTTNDTPSELGWRKHDVAVSTPQGAIFWGGDGPSEQPFGNAARIDPATGQFTLIPEPTTAITPSNARAYAGGWASSGRLWIWGGADKNIGLPTQNALGDGMSYDLGTQQWATMPTDGAPSARSQPLVVWTGKEAIVRGGKDASGKVLNDGAIFGQ